MQNSSSRSSLVLLIDGSSHPPSWRSHNVDSRWLSTPRNVASLPPEWRIEISSSNQNWRINSSSHNSTPANISIQKPHDLRANNFWWAFVAASVLLQPHRTSRRLFPLRSVSRSGIPEKAPSRRPSTQSSNTKKSKRWKLSFSGAAHSQFVEIVLEVSPIGRIERKQIKFKWN